MCGGAGCLLGRHYDAASWRQLRRIERPLATGPDEDGFYRPDTCAAACPVFAPETVERCYPVAVKVPVLPERIVTCSYVYGDAVRRRVPRAAIEAAQVEKDRMTGYPGRKVDQNSCAHFCSTNGQPPNFCTLEPDLPKAPAGDFVVCVYHHPGGYDPIIR
jgi:hypothetical protein